MTKHIGLLSPGLLKRRKEFEVALDGVAYFLPLSCFLDTDSVIVGWGMRRWARTARFVAEGLGKHYLTGEDGLLRSVRPGHVERSVSLVFDELGIYFDATRPSRFEHLVISAVEAAEDDLSVVQSGREVMDALRQNRLSKYNDSYDQTVLPEDLQALGRFVLIVDQTYDDKSIELGAGSVTSFEQMVKAALADNPDHRVVIKIHPEVYLGRKKGYLHPDQLAGFLSEAERARISFLMTPVNIWTVFEHAVSVYVVTSQIGFEALNAALPVHVFGMPFYAGWGLTEDHALSGAEGNRQSVIADAISRRAVIGLADIRAEHLYYAFFERYMIYVIETAGRLQRGDFSRAVREILNRLADQPA
ncbi:hypothetical protein [Coralliovum pocilloporae]|uniref:capsular polysaccharide export protein, LipB/KpsS family n=1 Tax=Coralliovum pocilloporae TaxID=3066369 RepID=UPI003306FF86